MADTKLNAADDVASGCERLMAALGRLKAETAKIEPIAPPEQIPDGWRWDGEYRLPKKDEWVIAKHSHPGEAFQATYDWWPADKPRYIIYKIEPKFKPGDRLVDDTGCVALMSADGPRWLHGGVICESDDHRWRKATDADIQDYFRTKPGQPYSAVLCLQRIYAKEANNDQ